MPYFSGTDKVHAQAIKGSSLNAINEYFDPR
jgi:hypothetical protein